MKKICFSLLSIAVLVAAMSFIAPQRTVTKELKIKFANYFGNAILKLDSAHYKNELGQDITISKFKYYISNIILKNKQGENYSCPDLFLVNEEETSSKEIVLKNITSKDISSISFTIGVDSIHNCSGAQSGALDPINAMFWTWNTGYIFLKLEGHSPSSASPGNIFEFHIGGYKRPNNCIRTINLRFDHTLLMNDVSATIHIKADAAELFKTPNTIDLSKISSVTDHHYATTISDNYSDMFSIEYIDQ